MAPYSELDHSEKEEGGRYPGSKCPPFIDPWYGTHIHFLVVLGDYSPLPSGRMWLSIYHRDMEVSWAPLASIIPNLDICKGSSLLMPILFKFESSTSLGWKEWVDTELFDVGFMTALQQASVLKAIISSQCLSNYRDFFNLHHLVRWWCSTNHTFFLSCDEITVTLEDVANLLLQPILGDMNPNDIELSTKEEAVEAKLRKGMSGNAKLSHRVRAFFKAPTAICHTAFVTVDTRFCTHNLILEDG